MKAGVHPAYQTAKIVCACGATYEVGSTRPQMRVDVCARCHPFFTGSGSRVVDTAGRIERFRRKYQNVGR